MQLVKEISGKFATQWSTCPW